MLTQMHLLTTWLLGSFQGGVWRKRPSDSSCCRNEFPFVILCCRREDAMQKGLLTAIQIPMSVMHLANECWPALLTMAKCGNINCKSDVQVGAKGLEAGVFGAYHNVMINVSLLKDESLKAKVQQEAEEALVLGQEQSRQILEIADQRKEDIV
eukprot:m.23288 g.23288  ORF g.23288 m.23288 type:complete len:153 (+) comp28452_c0_seq8:1340-1798(+)